MIEDAAGNLWEYTSEGEDWAEGDGVALIMYDAGTPIIYDDIILSARYSGYWKN